VRGVNPADAARTVKNLVDVWDLAAERMLATVARRLARGITEDGWAENKARETLLVRSELRAIVERDLSSGLEERAVDALGAAYEMGEDTAAVLGRQIATQPGKVARLVSRFVAQLRGTFVPVIRAHEDVYQRAIGDSEALMQTGTIVRREAVAQAVDRLVADGQDRFEDRSQRRWHLDSYVRMAGRTAALQASVEGQLDGMVARGKDLVVISDSPRECERCRPWEGKLLSITGDTSGEVDGITIAGTIGEAVAAGLWHPNCTHRPDPYVSGLTRIPEPKQDPAGYAAAQKQRALERDVRELKRRLAAVQELGDTSTARALRGKIRAKHQQLADNAEEHGLNRRRERERPVEGTPDDTTDKAAGTTPGPKPKPAPDPEPAVPAPRAAEPSEPVGPVLDEEPVRVLYKVDGPVLGDLVPVGEPTDEETRTITAAVEARFNGTHAGFEVETTEVRAEAGKLVVAGRVRSASGEDAGEWQREFYRDEAGAVAAYHGYLQLGPEFQGQGFAKSFNATMYEWYLASGLTYVKTYADVDVGGYTWARQGWEFEQEREARRVLERVRRYMTVDGVGPDEVAAAEALLARAEQHAFGSDGFPSAFEISQLGRRPGRDPWLGKSAMLGSDWNAVLWL